MCTAFSEKKCHSENTKLLGYVLARHPTLLSNGAPADRILMLELHPSPFTHCFFAVTLCLAYCVRKQWSYQGKARTSL